MRKWVSTEVTSNKSDGSGAAGNPTCSCSEISLAAA